MSGEVLRIHHGDPEKRGVAMPPKLLYARVPWRERSDSHDVCSQNHSATEKFLQMV